MGKSRPGQTISERIESPGRRELGTLVKVTGKANGSYWQPLRNDLPQELFRQEAEVLSNAKKQGLFIEPDDFCQFTRTLREAGGNEHSVWRYISPNGKIYYIRATKNGFFGRPHATPELYLKRWDTFNKVVPDKLKIRLLGVTTDRDGGAVILTAQPASLGLRVTIKQLEKALLDNGWERFGHSNGVLAWKHVDTGIVMEDVHEGNVYLHAGKPSPFDVSFDHIPRQFNEQLFVSDIGE